MSCKTEVRLLFQISTEGKKLSIFAQMQQKKSSQASRQPEVSPDTSHLTQSTIKKVLGPSEAQRIHEENAQKLSGMSTDEILAEKQKLMESLDPSMLQFLRSRKRTLPTLGEASGPSEESMQVGEVPDKRAALDLKTQTKVCTTLLCF